MNIRVPAAKRRAAADQRYLTFDQAARRAGVSKRTVQAWAAARRTEDGKARLATVKQGRVVRIDVYALDEFLAS